MSRQRLAILALCAAGLLSGAAPDVVQRAGAVVEVSAPAPEFGEADVAEFMRRVNPSLSDPQVRRITNAVMRFSEKYALTPELVTAVLWRESDARPWVRSPKGAVGLMQVMPHMFQPLDMAGNISTIESNVEAGCWILADNIRRLGEEEGILAYFWGSEVRGASYLHRVREAREALLRPSES